MERCVKDITEIKCEEFSSHESMIIPEKASYVISEDSSNFIKAETSDLYFDHDVVEPAHIKTNKTEKKVLSEHDSTMFEENGNMSKHINNFIKIEIGDSFITKDEIKAEGNSDIESSDTLESPVQLEIVKVSSEADEKQSHTVVQKSADEPRYKCKNSPYVFYKCEMCPCVFKYKSDFSKHTISHLVIKHKRKQHTLDKCSAKLTIYKCDVCEYETTFEWNLLKHTLRHKVAIPRAEVAMQKCKVCPYEAKEPNLAKQGPVELGSEAGICLKTQIKARFQRYMGSLPSRDALV